ncbi:MAG TPA: serine hydrolase [Gemmataceae bacterium]|nr:serine hydrolase [Gemmataceae bacterium]
MPYRVLFTAVLFACLTAAPARPQPPKASPDRIDGPPVVSAKAWAIADGKTGKVLWGTNEADPLAIASTTKIMTAWIVLRLATDDPKVLDEVMTISERAAKTGGTSAGIRAGEKIAVRDMLYGLLLPSGNDAAVALAEHVGPRFRADGHKEEDGLALFVAEMNRRAAALKIAETKYLDPNGLGLNKSSARDLALLTSTALQNKLFREYVQTRQHEGTATDPTGEKRTITWQNTNRLLGIEGYDGVKTGTTNAAGSCLVASGHRGSDHLIVVVLGCTSNDSRYVDSRNLFRWGWQQRGHKPEGAGELRLPRDNLLLYRGEDGKSRPVTTVEEWAKRRAEIVRGMEAVMGRLPGQEKRCPLDVRTEEETDCGKYVRRLVSYESEPGSRVPAYLLIPKDVLKGDKKVPAILCLHGTDNVVGHGTVVGLGKNPNRQYASELAERGYVCLAPNYPLLAKYQPDIQKLGWESGTLKAVWDNIRGLDLLASLPFVDAKAMGAIGHSLGGHNSVYTAVFDERLKVVVSSCGLDSFLDYYDGKESNWEPEKGWCQTRYMPKLANYKGRLAEIPFDFHELIGALAPRHVLIIAPKQDSNFRADSVDRIAAAARPVFKLHGHPDRLRVEHPDGGHDFPPEMRELAYKLFDTVLAGKPPAK